MRAVRPGPCRQYGGAIPRKYRRGHAVEFTASAGSGTVTDTVSVTHNHVTAACPSQSHSPTPAQMRCRPRGQQLQGAAPPWQGTCVHARWHPRTPFHTQGGPHTHRNRRLPLPEEVPPIEPPTSHTPRASPGTSHHPLHIAHPKHACTPGSAPHSPPLPSQHRHRIRDITASTLLQHSRSHSAEFNP
jgi:hypothetical protein